ncbi:hypothetical protein [Burkholderia sp. L27(2015)]|uniref:hypothetical protein n=1 Tax=Burkholderia sp. L27(2015) TaxID=1641858 RepID=UPI00131E0029|nr:hypothetical protein [Burkholderia sp. L27(2015)]
MMTRLRRTALATALLCSATGVLGADFDGSKPLICATVDAHACDPGEVCLHVLPDSIGMPEFMRIDFAKKAIVGPKRTTEIRYTDKSADQVLLQGTELGYAWTIALDTADGSMTLTLVSRDDAFVVFGHCIPP